MTSVLQQIMQIFQAEAVPLDAQIAIASAVLGEVAQSGEIDVKWSETGGIQVLDRNGAVIAQWNPAGNSGGR